MDISRAVRSGSGGATLRPMMHRVSCLALLAAMLPGTASPEGEAGKLWQMCDDLARPYFARNRAASEVDARTEDASTEDARENDA